MCPNIERVKGILNECERHVYGIYLSHPTVEHTLVGLLGIPVLQAQLNG